MVEEAFVVVARFAKRFAAFKYVAVEDAAVVVAKVDVPVTERVPVSERDGTVSEFAVSEPTEAIAENKLVDEAVVAKKLVEVAFEKSEFPVSVVDASEADVVAERTPTVAMLVREVDALRAAMFARSALVVDAFVVDAFEVRKFEVVPHSVVIVARVAES